VPRAERVLDYIVRIWRRPITLHTIDDRNASRVLSVRPR